MLKPQHRENHVGILIEAEAQIDIEIGFLKLLYQNNPGMFSHEPPFDDINKMIEIKKSDELFLYRWFNGKLTKELIDEIYESYKTEKTGELIAASPDVPSIHRLINLSHRVNRDIMFTTLILDRPEYRKFLEYRFPKCSYIEAPRDGDFNFKPYARFIIEDIDRLINYGKIEFTYITVMDYAKNYAPIGGKKILKADPLYVYGQMNEFNIMDPLITTPKGGK